MRAAGHRRLSRSRGRLGPALGALVLAGVATACSSGRSASPSTSTARPSSSTTTVASSSTSSSPGTTSPASAPACLVGSLSVAESQAHSSVGAGTTDLAVAVTNHGTSRCSFSGYPSLGFESAAASGTAPASPIHLSVTHAGPPAGPVVLAPGGEAGFYIVYTDVPVNGGGCTPVGSIVVSLPGTSGSLPLTASFSACGGAVSVYALVPLASLTP